MAKHIFSILNMDNRLWVDIFNIKYKDWHPWKIPYFPRSSWFFKSISNSAILLKNNLQIISCNPLSVDLWKDPYLLDIPVSFKPTFLNMDGLLENISFSDLIIGNSFSQISLENIFGFSLNWDWIDRIKIDPLCSNLWVWGPQNNLTSITS